MQCGWLSAAVRSSAILPAGTGLGRSLGNTGSQGRRSSRTTRPSLARQISVRPHAEQVISGWAQQSRSARSSGQYRPGTVPVAQDPQVDVASGTGRPQSRIRNDQCQSSRYGRVRRVKCQPWSRGEHRGVAAKVVSVVRGGDGAATEWRGAIQRRVHIDSARQRRLQGVDRIRNAGRRHSAGRAHKPAQPDRSRAAGGGGRRAGGGRCCCGATLAGFSRVRLSTAGPRRAAEPPLVPVVREYGSRSVRRSRRKRRPGSHG